MIRPNELTRPIPATRTVLVATVGSSSSAPMDRPACWSVSGVQVGDAAVALKVRQMPPLTEPTQRMFGSLGWATTVCTAPATSLLGVTLSTWPPVIGLGPWAT